MPIPTSRPSPIKKKLPKLSKDKISGLTERMSVSVVLDETVAQVTDGARSLAPVMAGIQNSVSSDASVTDQLPLPLSLDRGIEILMTEEDSLQASNILPLPSYLQEELLHNNLLCEVD